MVHPLVERGSSIPNYFELVAGSKGHWQDQNSIFDSVSWEIVSQFSFECGHETEVLRHILVENNLYNHFSSFFIHFHREVLQNVAIVIFKHDVECWGQMMIFQNALIRVPNCQGMLGSNDKLIRVSWMFIIMNDIWDKHCELIKFLQLALQIAYGQ